jgi:alpha-beta hydrolase superfamily lysophospholipase
MQPVVILGGFLITDEAYGPMAEWLRAQGGIDVSVVHASRLDWLLTSSAWGWQRLLQRVDHCVRQTRERCAGAPVTLVGHSSGGVMLRLYLAEHGL